MNLKKCKKLRKISRKLAPFQQTIYGVVERRVMRIIDGEQRNFIKIQVVLHPECFRGVYKSFKKGL